MPSRLRFCVHRSPSARFGQAALVATDVRYGPMRTVAVVVTYAELAQSYQYQARCSRASRPGGEGGVTATSSVMCGSVAHPEHGNGLPRDLAAGARSTTWSAVDQTP